jgi:hypothetical protein
LENLGITGIDFIGADRYELASILGFLSRAFLSGTGARIARRHSGEQTDTPRWNLGAASLICENQ